MQTRSHLLALCLALFLPLAWGRALQQDASADMAPAPEAEGLVFSTCSSNGELCTGYPISYFERNASGVCNCSLQPLLGHCDCFVSALCYTPAPPRALGRGTALHWQHWRWAGGLPSSAARVVASCCLV